MAKRNETFAFGQTAFFHRVTTFEALPMDTGDTARVLRNYTFSIFMLLIRLTYFVILQTRFKRKSRVKGFNE